MLLNSEGGRLFVILVVMNGMLEFSYVIAVLVFLAQVVILVLVWAVVFQKTSFSRKVIGFLGKSAFTLGFLVALSATLASLVYSEVFHLIPCELCWWQRVLMFPQVVILGFASVWENKHSAFYGLVFSMAGFLTGVYQIMLQSTKVESIFCAPGTVDCSEVLFSVAGYVTLPVMSATAFGLIALLMIGYLIDKDTKWYSKIMMKLKLK